MKKMMYSLVILASMASTQIFAIRFWTNKIYNYTEKDLYIKINVKDASDENVYMEGTGTAEDMMKPQSTIGGHPYRAIEVWGELGKIKVFRNQDEYDRFLEERPNTVLREGQAVVYDGPEEYWPAGMNPREITIKPKLENGIAVGGYEIDFR